MPALPGEPLTEEQRRPLIDGPGRRLLTDLLEHANAPRYNHTCGDRLTAIGLATVRAFDDATAIGPVPSPPGGVPAWVTPFADRCLRTVPAYRSLGATGSRFDRIPTTGPETLVREPWSFVPDDHPLDDMVVFTTSGTTTGQEAFIASTPEATASYQALLRAALRTRGLTLDGGPGRVAVAQVCWQRFTFTYASISSFLGQAGILKLNLNPADWRDAGDVASFLDAIEPEVITGDPVAFAHLAELPVTVRPKALLSTAMALLPGLQAELETRFGCPVIDIYGMNEAGPIAAALPDGRGHVVIQPTLHVEIIGPDGAVLPSGERGEIVLTGGFNPALPLLRYRTGDHAALLPGSPVPVLVDLEGRAPVPFRSADGRAVNTIDITVALRALSVEHPPLRRYRLHQNADSSLLLRVDRSNGLRSGPGSGSGDLASSELADRCVAALTELFGRVVVDVQPLADDGEAITYSTDPASA